MSPDEIENQQDYDQYVKETVDIMLEEYEPEDCMDMSEIVFETVDSSRAIMITANNLTVLEYSHVGPDDWSHMIDDSMHYTEVIQVLAYDALRNDIWREIHSRDIEI